jgi:S1-C subfamily serine protease
MLLLAGLVSPMQAKNKDNETPAAKVAATDEVAYAGFNVGPRVEAANATVPAGVGILVGFIDPKGPSVGKVEEGDILTRLDDQMLFNAEQFRALVRTRKPGDKVKLTLVRVRNRTQICSIPAPDSRRHMMVLCVSVALNTWLVMARLCRLCSARSC